MEHDQMSGPRVHFATENELIQAWHGQVSLPELARKWNVHYETIRQRWNGLKKEGRLPNRRRGSASNLVGRLSFDKGKEKLDAYNRLQSQLAETNEDDEKQNARGSSALLELLRKYHGPAPRFDIPKPLMAQADKQFVRKLRVIHPEGDPHIEPPTLEMRA